ncbi:MAG: hypothetical protein WDN24_02815 [Sphingomonas sp.]
MRRTVPPGPRDPLAIADANNDGTVTRDELLASVATRFKKVDTDNDGKISKEERIAQREAMPGRMGKHGGHRMGRRMRGGPDADGAVTLAEQQALAVRRFDWVDGNKDGKVDAAERTAIRDKMTAMRGPGGPGHPGARVNPDANGDGVVTLDEQQALTKRRFDLVDTNHDGRIDQAERAAVRAKLMAMRGPGGFRGRRGPPPPPADGPDAPPRRIGQPVRPGGSCLFTRPALLASA